MIRLTFTKICREQPSIELQLKLLLHKQAQGSGQLDLYFYTTKQNVIDCSGQVNLLLHKQGQSSGPPSVLGTRPQDYNGRQYYSVV